MIKTFVGLPGAGKSLYYSWLIAVEIKRIARGKSMYDVVAVNFDWDDGKGNFARYVYRKEDCDCIDAVEDYNWEYKYPKYDRAGNGVGVPDAAFRKHWHWGGNILAFEDLPDLYDVVNCLVFVDEAGYLLNSMDWDSMDEGYKGFLLHHRKNITHIGKRFDLYIATQHKDIVEITLRRISNNIFWIRPIFLHKNPDRPPRFLLPVILIYYYKQHEIRNMPAPMQLDNNGMPKKVSEDDELELLKLVHVYWIGKKYRNYYNTLQKVDKLRKTKKK